MLFGFLLDSQSIELTTQQRIALCSLLHYCIYTISVRVFDHIFNSFSVRSFVVVRSLSIIQVRCVARRRDRATLPTSAAARGDRHVCSFGSCVYVSKQYNNLENQLQTNTRSLPNISVVTGSNDRSTTIDDDRRSASCIDAKQPSTFVCRAAVGSCGAVIRFELCDFVSIYFVPWRKFVRSIRRRCRDMRCVEQQLSDGSIPLHGNQKHNKCISDVKKKHAHTTNAKHNILTPSIIVFNHLGCRVSCVNGRVRSRRSKLLRFAFVFWLEKQNVLHLNLVFVLCLSLI